MESDTGGLALGFILIFGCIALNAFFVIAEYSLIRVRSSRIQELVDKGNFRAKFVAKMQEDLEGYLSATQLGITLMSLILGWIGEPAVSKLLMLLVPDSVTLSATVTHTLSIVVAFTFITFLQIVFAELVPRGVAIRNAEFMALLIAPVLFAFHKIFRPLLFIFDRASKFFLRLLGIKIGARPKEKLSEDELRLVLMESLGKGALADTKLDLIDNVFDFSRRTAKQVMVARDDIVSLDVTKPVMDNLKKAKDSGHTRYPLCDGSLEHVVGLLNIKDVLLEDDLHLANLDLSKVRREILFVPENKPLTKLMKEFQRNKIHMAIVVDEFAVTVGLVTLEDVLEELVGEIQDEYDHEAAPIQLLKDGTYSIQGAIMIEEVEEKLNIKVEKAENTTIGGAIMSKLGRLPRVGDQVEFDGFKFLVKTLKGRRILTVTAARKPRNVKEA